MSNVYLSSVIYGLHVSINRLDITFTKVSEGIALIVQVDQLVGRWIFKPRVVSSTSVLHMLSLN